MADANDPNVAADSAIAKLAEALKVFRTGISDVGSILEKLFGDKVKAGLTTGARVGVEEAKKIIGEEMESEVRDALSSGIQSGLGLGKEFFKNAVGEFERGLNAVEVSLKAAFDPDAMGGLSRQLVDFSGQHSLELGVFIGAEKLEDQLKTTLPMNLESKFMDFSKNVAPGMAQFARDAGDVGGLVEGAMKQAGDAMERLGISSSEAENAIKTLSAAGLDVAGVFGQDFSVKIDTGDGLAKLNALQTAELLAQGTGLGLQKTTQDIQIATQRLGYSAGEAADMFGTFKQVQEGTRLPMSEIESALVSAADRLAFFGGKVETVASTYKSLLNVVGEANQALAKDIFQNVVGSLAQMNMNFRAFLGTTGSIGGAGGAIGAGLRVEKALETGEGLEGVMNDIKSTLERASGTGVLTREQAMATGQENQFYMQRQLLQQFMPQLDVGQANKVLEMFAGGRQVKTTDLERDREVKTKELADIGRRQLNEQIGPIEQALNRLGSINIQSIRQMHTDFINLETSGNNFIKNFIHPFREALEGGGEAITKRKPEEMEKLMRPEAGTPGLVEMETAAKRSIGLGAGETMATRPLGLIGFEAGPRAQGLEMPALTPPTVGALRPPTGAAIEVAREEKHKVSLDIEAKVKPIQIPITLDIDERGNINVKNMVQQHMAEATQQIISSTNEALNNDIGQ